MDKKECQKHYYLKNKANIDARAKAYEDNPRRKEWRKAYRRQYHLTHRDRHNQMQHQRRVERKALRDRIALHYGCQNPGCLWTGTFEPCQLDFHHFDQSEKDYDLGQMRTMSLKRFVAEVNKCVILCRACHPLFHLGRFALNESAKIQIDPETLEFT